LKKTVPVWKAKNIRAKKTSEKKTAIFFRHGVVP